MMVPASKTSTPKNAVTVRGDLCLNMRSSGLDLSAPVFSMLRSLTGIGIARLDCESAQSREVSVIREVPSNFEQNWGAKEPRQQ